MSHRKKAPLHFLRYAQLLQSICGGAAPKEEVFGVDNENMTKTRFLAIAILWSLSQFHGVQAAPIETAMFNGQTAFRLSDGQNEAIVVPALSGRVMRFGAIGGENWLWNLPPEKATGGGFQNWGGDKTFVGPHPLWGTFASSIWPPDASWDGPAFEAEITSENHLKTVGPMWRGFGVRVEREFWLENGEFVIRQTLEKVEGEPRLLSIWNVAQAAPPDAVFVPLNANTPYKAGFHAFGKLKAAAKIERLSPTLLQILPAPGAAYKIGADSPVSAIVAVRGQTAWRIRADKPKGEYPEGAAGAGFPVEFYNHSDPAPGHYVELELLSPLRRFVKGNRWTHTVRWSLHTLPSSDFQESATRAAIEKLLNSPPAA